MKPQVYAITLDQTHTSTLPTGRKRYKPALLQGSVAVATPLWRGTAATNVGFRAYLDVPGAKCFMR